MQIYIVDDKYYNGEYTNFIMSLLNFTVVFVLFFFAYGSVSHPHIFFMLTQVCILNAAPHDLSTFDLSNVKINQLSCSDPELIIPCPS